MIFTPSAHSHESTIPWANISWDEKNPNARATDEDGEGYQHARAAEQHSKHSLHLAAPESEAAATTTRGRDLGVCGDPILRGETSA